MNLFSSPGGLDGALSPVNKRPDLKEKELKDPRESLKKHLPQERDEAIASKIFILIPKSLKIPVMCGMGSRN